MDPHNNPAEFILEVTGAGIPKTVVSPDSQPEENQKGKEKEDDEELGKRDENFYAESYKASSFYSETEAALSTGIYPEVSLSWST